jgi:hypothetical protein
MLPLHPPGRNSAPSEPADLPVADTKNCVVGEFITQIADIFPL